jgi:hypothetical protein
LRSSTIRRGTPGSRRGTATVRRSIPGGLDDLDDILPDTTEPTFGIFQPYALPLPNQILPVVLLTQREQELILDEDFLLATRLDVEILRNAFLYSMWFSISAKFKDIGYRCATVCDGVICSSPPRPSPTFRRTRSESVRVQFEAVEQDDGSRGINEPIPTNIYNTPPPRLVDEGDEDALTLNGGGLDRADRDDLNRENKDDLRRDRGGFGRGYGDDAIYDTWDTFFAPWLGCRCSWPVTQLCWYLCYGAQLAQWFAFTFTVLTLIFQLAILDAMVEANFLAIIPRITTWSEWWYADTPWVPRVVWMVGKLFVFWFVVGIGENSGTSRGFLAPAQLRSLLATMANRHEGQTYAYCTVIVWTVVIEMETVALLAYLVRANSHLGPLPAMAARPCVFSPRALPAHALL